MGSGRISFQATRHNDSQTSTATTTTYQRKSKASSSLASSKSIMSLELGGNASESDRRMGPRSGVATCSVVKNLLYSVTRFLVNLKVVGRKRREIRGEIRGRKGRGLECGYDDSRDMEKFRVGAGAFAALAEEDNSMAKTQRTQSTGVMAALDQHGTCPFGTRCILLTTRRSLGGPHRRSPRGLQHLDRKHALRAKLQKVVPASPTNNVSIEQKRPLSNS